jgi:MobA/MobL family
MAIYYLGVKSFGRNAGAGGSVSTSAAAYRSGEKIRDERTGRIYDHTSRRDIEYTEILLPSYFNGSSSRPDWALDRSRLWNAVEQSEPRMNARVAREYLVALPHELNPEQRTNLARSFAQEISDRYRNAVDLAIHRPRTDPRNFHAHLLSTTREVTVAGLGPKTTAELNGSQRFELGLPRAMLEHARIRGRWAAMANEALRDAGIEARVSHIPDPEAIHRPGAEPWLPRVAWEMERRGIPSILGDRAREQFARRREAGIESSRGIPGAARKSIEEVRNRAIEEWREIRAELRRGSSAESVSPEAGPEPKLRELDEERQVDTLRRELGRDDFGL